jgi:hypothetical protein
VLVVLVGIAGGLVMYQFLIRPAPPASPPPPPPAASIKFAVQPADAVVEIGGREVGHSSPFDTELEPGVISVVVRRQGYKPWGTQITLHDGDKQTVRVALEIGTAHLSVSSQPPGLAAQLDGKQLDQITPLETQIPAGPHQLIVSNSAGLTWAQDFTAEVDGRYTFNAPLTAAKRAGSTAATGSPSVSHPPAMAPSAPAPDRNDRGDHPRRTGTEKLSRAVNKDTTAESDVRAPEPDQELPAPPRAAPPRIDAGVSPVMAPEPARSSPTMPSGSRTPVVSATAVTKLAGEIPTMKVNGITENYADVIAKMCIDELGRMASVRVLKAIPEITAELQQILMGWHYKPYLNSAGQPSPACFPLSFRVVFKRAG